MHDVIIIGGGPAGLNAAVVLGRCRREVLLFDTGEQRNRSSHGIHNYLTRDDMMPADFLNLARKEIRKYNIQMIRKEIIHAERIQNNGFLVRDSKGKNYYTKKLLIATGLRDKLPDIEGLESLYGKSVFHCPYCDGWEVRDKKIGVYAKNKNGYELAVSLKTWSSRVILYTDGRNYLKPEEKKILDNKRIEIISKKIKSLEGKNGKLRNIVFNDQEKQPCEALFFVNGYEQRSALAIQLGCPLSKTGLAITNRLQQAIPGLYVAGDASMDVQFVVMAGAEGAKAGVSINKELQKEELVK